MASSSSSSQAPTVEEVKLRIIQRINEVLELPWSSLVDRSGAQIDFKPQVLEYLQNICLLLATEHRFPPDTVIPVPSELLPSWGVDADLNLLDFDFQFFYPASSDAPFGATNHVEMEDVLSTRLNVPTERDAWKALGRIKDNNAATSRDPDLELEGDEGDDGHPRPGPSNFGTLSHSLPSSPEQPVRKKSRFSNTAAQPKVMKMQDSNSAKTKKKAKK